MNVFQAIEDFPFPNPLETRDEVVAWGGDLHPARLISAYLQGIFPWYSDDQPILWWSPDPRCILQPQDLKISKSMRQIFRRQEYQVTFDTCFEEVIQCCADVRYKNRDDTWINDHMIVAYNRLHELGLAHSVEVWDKDKKLVGGLYGVSMGSCFFGESMFHKASNASKYGFIALVQNLIQRDFKLIDCQVYNEHLGSLGAIEISKADFLEMLHLYTTEKSHIGSWSDWSFSQLKL